MPKGKNDLYKDVVWTTKTQPGDEVLQSLPGRRGYGYKGPGAGGKISPGASPIAVRRPRQYSHPSSDRLAGPDPSGFRGPAVIPDHILKQNAATAKQRAADEARVKKERSTQRSQSKSSQLRKDAKTITPSVYQGGKMSPDSHLLNSPLNQNQPKIKADNRTQGDWVNNPVAPGVGFSAQPSVRSAAKKSRDLEVDPMDRVHDVLKIAATAPLYGGAGRLAGPLVERIPVVGRTLAEINRTMIAGTTGRPVAPVKGMGPNIPTRGPRLTDPPVGPQKPMGWRKKPDPSLTPLERSLPPARSTKDGNVPDPRRGREGRLTSPKTARESANIEYHKDVVNRNRVVPNRRPGDLDRKLDLLTETSARPIAQARNEQIRLARADSFNPNAATDELILLEAKAGVPEAIAELRRRGIIAGRRASSSASPPPPRMDLKDLPF